MKRILGFHSYEMNSASQQGYPSSQPTMYDTNPYASYPSQMQQQPSQQQQTVAAPFSGYGSNFNPSQNSQMTGMMQLPHYMIPNANINGNSVGVSGVGGIGGTNLQGIQQQQQSIQGVGGVSGNGMDHVGTSPREPMYQQQQASGGGLPNKSSQPASTEPRDS